MPSMNPIEIPELANLVASYLEFKDFARCVLVSKSWWGMLLPHQWRVISVGLVRLETLGSLDELRWQGPHLDQLYRHRHLIRTLVLTDSAGLDKFDYPNLTRLRIDLSPCQERRISLDFTKACPSLVHLVLVNVVIASGTWMALSKHLLIKKLHLRGLAVEAVDTPVFWKACVKLESLTLERLHIKGGGIPKDMVFDRLRNLDMEGNYGMDYAENMNLVLQSPMLQSLKWEEYLSRGVETPLTRRPNQSNYCKLYIDLDIHDADLAFMLLGTGGELGTIVDLRLGYSCYPKTQALKALGLHFGTLVRVDLSRCFWVSGSTVLDILCSCPMLEVFHANSVFVMDIAEREPWICQQLRDLKICIQVVEAERDLQQLVFERLSTLVRLEMLEMRVPEGPSGGKDVLAFRLDCGLRQLASLQQLTTLSFDQWNREDIYMPQIEKDEVSWMLNNWKNLKIVAGRLNKNLELDASLRSIIESHGIGSSFSTLNDTLPF
ncbi:hypothetical protein BGX34_001833 [Mortierella sp. NVP85]|nr:hypothetical protein BGX34_001833 [Mortierella sp. NVP85]